LGDLSNDARTILADHLETQRWVPFAGRSHPGALGHDVQAATAQPLERDLERTHLLFWNLHLQDPCELSG
jgi:hypothetical protein